MQSGFVQHYALKSDAGFPQSFPQSIAETIALIFGRLVVAETLLHIKFSLNCREILTCKNL